LLEQGGRNNKKNGPNKKPWVKKGIDGGTPSPRRVEKTTPLKKKGEKATGYQGEKKKLFFIHKNRKGM